jgi:hypothetical protein
MPDSTAGFAAEETVVGFEPGRTALATSRAIAVWSKRNGTRRNDSG